MSNPGAPGGDDTTRRTSPQQGSGGPPPWQRGGGGRPPSSPGSTRTDARTSDARTSDARTTETRTTETRSSDARPGHGIDAPTSQIRRSDVPTDMPDLSTTRRPSQDAAARAPRSRGGARDRDGGRRPVASVSTSGRGSRRASLQIKHIDPWSTLKLSLVLSVALFLVWMIAVGVLYLVLDGLSVWDRINSTFSDFVTVSDPGGSSDPLIGPQQVFSVAAVVGLVNIVLFTALTTVSSFVYNISADLAGGVELTLTERD